MSLDKVLFLRKEYVINDQSLYRSIYDFGKRICASDINVSIMYPVIFERNNPHTVQGCNTIGR